MKKTFILFASVTAIFIGWTASAAAGEFMADFKQYSSWEEESSRNQAGKIYFKEGATRMEIIRGGQKAEIMIANPRKKKGWLLNTEDKTYMEIRFSDKPWQKAGTGDKPDSITETRFGRETIAGYSCEKTVYSLRDEPEAQTTVWMSPRLGYPVKWEHKDREGKSTFSLSNIKEGNLKDSLFVLPKGYRDISDDEEASSGDDREESEAAKVVKDDAKDIAGDAKGAAKDEVSNIVTDSVREGIRGIFK